MAKFLTGRVVPAAATVALIVGAAACGDGDGDAAGGFCDQSRVADSFDRDFGSLADDADPEKVREVLDGYLAAAEAATAEAPSQVEEAAETVTAALKDLRDIASNNDFDLAEVADDPAFADLAGDQSLQDAGEELEAFLESECGIAPDSSTADSTPTDSSTADSTSPDSAPDDTGGSSGSGAPTSGGAADEGLAEQLADEFASGAGITLTDEQRTCVGQGLLDDIGLGTLAELADATSIDSGTLSKIFAVLDGCGVTLPSS